MQLLSYVTIATSCLEILSVARSGVISKMQAARVKYAIDLAIPTPYKMQSYSQIHHIAFGRYTQMTSVSPGPFAGVKQSFFSFVLSSELRRLSEALDLLTVVLISPLTQDMVCAAPMGLRSTSLSLSVAKDSSSADTTTFTGKPTFAIPHLTSFSPQTCHARARALTDRWEIWKLDFHQAQRAFL
jgi:hypothetical protein